MLFHILSKESKRQGSIVLELTDSSFKLITPKEAFGIASAQEKEIISRLECQGNRYSASLRECIPLLKKIAALGSLYIDKNKAIADFFSKIPLVYKAEFQDNGLVSIVPFASMGKEIPLDALDLVLPTTPPLFFKNNFLKLFDPDLDMAWIKRALKENPIVVEPRVFAKWVKEAKELPECSPIILEENKMSQNSKATPAIQLRDQRGVFVDFLLDRTNFFALTPPLSQDILDLEKDLIEAGYAKRPVEGCYYCPSDAALDAVELLLEVGWEVLDRSGKEVRLLKEAAITFHADKEKIRVENTGSAPCLECALQGKHLVPFQDGSFGLLPKGFMIQCASLAADIEEEGGVRFIPKFKAGALIANDLFKDSLPPSIQDIKEKLLNQEKASFEKKGFQGTLRPYQDTGYSWLRSLYNLGFHGILADEMGLGKTVQVLALFSSIEKKSGCPHLIVMPKSLLFNWRREFERFLPGFKVHVHSGQGREKNPERLRGMDVVLTSYPLLRQDIDLFKAIDYHALVLDEAHLIKNASTKVSQGARELSAQLRLSLTGTPLENSVEDLLAQFSFLMPGLIKEGTQSLDQEALKGLRRKIRPFILRRKKKEVAKDLPEQINQTVFIEMEDEEKALYHELLENIRKGALQQLKTEGFAKSRFQIFEAILRLRQCACHSKLVSPLLEGKSGESAKLDLLIEEVDEAIASGSKALVFSQFTSMLDLIQNALASQKIPFVRLDGKTKNREEVVTRFQEETTPLVFLISLKAGGVGINLEKADYVFLYEPWWNESVEEQAIARAHRIGRVDPVIAKRYIVSGTIEEKILQLKERKTSLASLLLDDIDTPSSLSVEDIEFLFS